VTKRTCRGNFSTTRPPTGHAFLVKESPLRFGERLGRDEFLFKVRPPPSQRYNRLLRRLASLAQAVEHGGSRLEAGSEAIYEVINFLIADKAVKHGGLVRPLVEILRCLLDLEHGAKPKLFFQARRPPGITKATNLWRDYRRGQIVSAIDLLMRRARFSGEAAAKWIEHELKLRGILDSDGRRITARQILSWRNKVSDHTATEATREFADRHEQHSSIANATAAERRARELLDNLRRTEFPESPPESGNEN
jgi:hypothetical protein